jgi:hypothetical protein
VVTGHWLPPGPGHLALATWSWPLGPGHLGPLEIPVGQSADPGLGVVPRCARLEHNVVQVSTDTEGRGEGGRWEAPYVLQAVEAVVEGD